MDFALPRAEDRPAVLETTHAALYLLFNEGHLSTGEEPIRRELCRDAMYLTQLLADEPVLCTSDTLALLALMCLHAARLDSRIDAEGGVVPLDRQDRSRWDRALIARRYECLVRASRMGTVVASRYQLEAAIAARHCSARDFAETDWGLRRTPFDSSSLNHAPHSSMRPMTGERVRSGHPERAEATSVEAATGRSSGCSPAASQPRACPAARRGDGRPPCARRCPYATRP